jgi:hypothetical protein
MTVGAWWAAFPVPLGGGDERVLTIFKALRADRPEPLRAEGGESELEDEAFALMIGQVYDRAEARVIQSQDPGAATGEMLVRWERLYDVVPDAAAGEAERRAIVSAKHRAASRSNRPADLFDAIAPLFASLTFLRATVADVPGGLMHRWPGGAGTTDRPGTADAMAWTSDLGRLIASVRHLPGLDRPAKKRREAAASEILDQMLPAQMTFAVQDADSGFQLGVETFPGTF